MKTQTKGILYLVATGLLFSIGGLCIKYIPWHPLAVNSARSILSALVFGVFLLGSRYRLQFNRRVLLGALCFALTCALFTIANKLTTAGNAIILQYTAPIFIILLLWLFQRQKPTRTDVIACVAVLVGLICFFIDGLTAGNMIGNLVAVSAGLTYAGVFMVNGYAGGDAKSALFFGILLAVLIGLPWLVKVDFAATAPDTWLALAALGLLQQGLATVLFYKGISLTPPVASSLICGLEPILNPVWVALFYGEMLGPMALPGAVIVLAAIFWYNLQKRERPA